MRQNGFWRVGLMVGALLLSPLARAEDAVPESNIDFAALREALIKARAAESAPRLHTSATLLEGARKLSIELLALELPHLGLEASPRVRDKSAAQLGLLLAAEWKKEMAADDEFHGRLDQVVAYWKKEVADTDKIQQVLFRTMQIGRMYAKSEMRFKEAQVGASHALVDADLELGETTADISFLQMRLPSDQRTAMHDLFTLARLRSNAIRRFERRHGCEARLQNPAS